MNTLNFNQKGNLLASSSDDISVVIWDWAIGKKNHSFDSGHRSNVFQVCKSSILHQCFISVANINVCIPNFKFLGQVVAI